MKENIRCLLEEIRFSYTALQMNLYLELYIKTDNKFNNSVGKMLNWWDFDINIDSNKYLLRKDYIKYWLETSVVKELNWWIMGDMAIIHSFAYITKNFKELITNENAFKNYVEKKSKENDYDYNAFYQILNLIRNISVHWSISKNYTLKKKDIEPRKTRLVNKGIYQLNLDVDIVRNLHRLKLFINVEEIKVWYNFSSIFGMYEMLMFIELCMKLIHYYDEQIKTKQ